MMELTDIDINEDNLDFSQVKNVSDHQRNVNKIIQSHRFVKLLLGSRTKEMRDRLGNYFSYKHGICIFR